jgi:hypothetical protein
MLVRKHQLELCCVRWPVGTTTTTTTITTTKPAMSWTVRKSNPGWGEIFRRPEAHPTSCKTGVNYTSYTAGLKMGRGETSATLLYLHKYIKV